MRFLHTGDLHLDSAFCAYGERGAQSLREEGRELLRAIFECAKKEECKMILFSGDIFDSKTVTPESAELFCSLVESCDIPVVVSPGNHDSYSQSSFYAQAAKRLGDKLTLFTSSELQFFDFDDLRVRVFGYAFTAPVLSQSPLLESEMPEENGYLRILCAHADMASPISRYAPVTLSELTRWNFAYSAFGHIHNRGEKEDADGRVRYCGFAQGRGFDEIGRGGAWIVDADEDACECKRVILSNTAFYIAYVDLSYEDDFSGAKAKICGEINLQNHSKGAKTRVILSGSVDPSVIDEIYRNKDEIQKLCGVYYVEFVDETLPMMDGEYLERDTTLRGEFYRTLLPKLSSDNAEERRVAIKALQIGLAAIDGKSILKIRD